MIFVHSNLNGINYLNYKTMNKLEKQILEILNRNYMFLKEYDKSAAKEIASLMEQKADINTPFFGNSGANIPVTEQQCQKRDELIRVQEEYIEHLKLCSYHEWNIRFDDFEPKIEQLKKELK